jgi:F420-dependent oxidoreductase-like protein
MRLGIMLGYPAKRLEAQLELITEADKLGVWAVWTAEAYGSDAVSPLAWIGSHTRQIKLGTAVMQIPGRTPANTAMTAMSLNQLSGGRFLLGLGLSGPQVAEGWHGQSYARPLTRTREYVSIVRAICKREAPVTHKGEVYQIPYTGANATGLGKPLKSTLDAEPNIPIYLAAIGPKNIELAAEIAEGWLPIFFSPERYDTVFKPYVDAGSAKANHKSFDIAPTVPVAMGEDLEVCYNALRPYLALYIGGMGAKGKNFYNDLARRYGYDAAAEEIQDLYLAGRKGEAMMKVPTELIDEVALVGPAARIKDRLALWKHSPVTTLNLATTDVNTLRALTEML